MSWKLRVVIALIGGVFGTSAGLKLADRWVLDQFEQRRRAAIDQDTIPPGEFQLVERQFRKELMEDPRAAAAQAVLRDPAKIRDGVRTIMIEIYDDQIKGGIGQRAKRMPVLYNLAAFIGFSAGCGLSLIWLSYRPQSQMIAPPGSNSAPAPPAGASATVTDS